MPSKKKRRRADTISIRFSPTPAGQESARQLFSALLGREVEPWGEALEKKRAEERAKAAAENPTPPTESK